MRWIVIFFAGVVAVVVAEKDISRDSVSKRVWQSMRNVKEIRSTLIDLDDRIGWLQADVRSNPDEVHQALLSSMLLQKKTLEEELADFEEWEKDTSFDETNLHAIQKGERVACGVCTSVVSAIGAHVRSRMSEEAIQERLLEEQCKLLSTYWPWDDILTHITEERREKEHGINRICKEFIHDFGEDLIEAISLGEDRECEDEEDIECDLCRKNELCSRTRKSLMQAKFRHDIEGMMQSEGLDPEMLSDPSVLIDGVGEETKNTRVRVRDHPTYKKYFDALATAMGSGGGGVRHGEGL
eukprot:g4561.t1